MWELNWICSICGSQNHDQQHPHCFVCGNAKHRSVDKKDPKLGPNADEDEKRATEEGRKVFVGNLKRPITREEVIVHFSKFGEVERVILNSGFGLVLMATREGALKATVERWQALGWRNVEVFVYTKGAKGASWNRPYANPPKPGKCGLCPKEAAEHCALCTSALCLVTNCTSYCSTCQRSFCKRGKECGNVLDFCDFCGSTTCLFCALRLDAICGQCNHLFSERIIKNARKRAEILVNSRISENDGSVYALVCLLKGDMESSREGQLVAAIDRASKCFDPRASSWCTLTALRAVKELEDSWEATRKVHNLRALRRSAKQWATDLSALSLQKQHASPTISKNNIIRNHDLFTTAYRACETFLLEFEPRPTNETNWLISNMVKISTSLTNKRIRFIDDLINRMEVWASLLHRIQFDHFLQPMKLNETISSVWKSIIALDGLYSLQDESLFMLKKDQIIGEAILCCRQLKNIIQPTNDHFTLLKRAGRSIRTIEMKSILVNQGQIPFETCFHQAIYGNCLDSKCLFSHLIRKVDYGEIFDSELEISTYEFSNENDDFSFLPVNTSTNLSVEVVSHHVSVLCNELCLENSLVPQITTAFLASGATSHSQIWDTDVAALYKELIKIPSLSGALRVRLLNLVTSRRSNFADVPPIASSLVVPPLL